MQNLPEENNSKKKENHLNEAGLKPRRLLDFLTSSDLRKPAGTCTHVVLPTNLKPVAFRSHRLIRMTSYSRSVVGYLVKHARWCRPLNAWSTASATRVCVRSRIKRRFCSPYSITIFPRSGLYSFLSHRIFPPRSLETSHFCRLFLFFPFLFFFLPPPPQVSIASRNVSRITETWHDFVISRQHWRGI